MVKDGKKEMGDQARNMHQVYWVELATSNLAAAKSFYGDLFGWAAQDMEIAEGMGPYSIQQIGDKPAAGVYELTEVHKHNPVPRQWVTYFSVDDVTDTAKRITAEGGALLVPPNEIEGMGTMCVAKDPTGVAFAVWQSAQGQVMSMAKKQCGALHWSELMTTNVDQAGSFYAKLFGWTLECISLAGKPYNMIKIGDQTVGGAVEVEATSDQMSPCWTNYFQVSNCATSLALIEASQGKRLMGPHTVDSIGTFAIARDPDGATFGIVEPETIT